MSRIRIAIVTFALAAMTVVAALSVMVARPALSRERVSRAIEATIASPTGEAIDIRTDNSDVIVDAMAGRPQAGTDARPETIERAVGHGSIVALRGTLYGNSQADLDAVRVTTDHRNGTTYVKVGPADDRHVRFSGDLHFSLPSDRALRVETSNGGVRIVDHRGRVAVETSNGAIDVRGAAATLALSSSNGGVDVALDPAWHGDSIDVSTSNGNVDISVPKGFAASLHATTSNGVVRNDAKPPGDRSGGIRIVATSSNGNVTVR